MYLYKTLKNLLLMNFFAFEKYNLPKVYGKLSKGIEGRIYKKVLYKLSIFLKIYIIQPKKFCLRIPKL